MFLSIWLKTKKNPQTALSYMCSTNTTHFLEALLQAPGIDINKPDNEFNTPLHYAAECGNLGAIRLLLLQNKLNMDAKNVFGFTPLMKAAIQGHICCAKTLLFASSCAELIEKWSRTRNLDKMPFTRKDRNDVTVIGRARANSTI